jgi:hypothetical protein
MNATFPRRTIFINEHSDGYRFQAEVFIEWEPGEGGIEYLSDWHENEELCIAEWNALREQRATIP